MNAIETIKYVALVDLAEVWGEIEVSREAAIARGAEFLDAEKTDDGEWRYYDEGAADFFESDDDDVAALGAALIAGHKDVYSIWCANF
jgi:hypothetical protein